MVVIRVQIGSKNNEGEYENEYEKKGKKYKCCVCFDKFEVDEICYAYKHLVDDFHICKKCAWTENIRKQIYDMIDFYYINRNKKPGIKYRIVAFFDRDSFDYIIVKAWMTAKEKIQKESSDNNSDRLRKVFTKNGAI